MRIERGGVLKKHRESVGCRVPSLPVMDQPEGGRKEQVKAESVKAFGADAGPAAAGREHPIRIAARASADAGMGVSENRTDGMRRDVARTGAVWPAESCLFLAGFISPFPGGD